MTPDEAAAAKAWMLACRLCDAEAGRDRFRAALGRWRDPRQPDGAGPDPEGVP